MLLGFWGGIPVCSWMEAGGEASAFQLPSSFSGASPLLGQGVEGPSLQWEQGKGGRILYCCASSSKFKFTIDGLGEWDPGSEDRILCLVSKCQLLESLFVVIRRKRACQSQWVHLVLTAKGIGFPALVLELAPSSPFPSLTYCVPLYWERLWPDRSISAPLTANMEFFFTKIHSSASGIANSNV